MASIKDLKKEIDWMFSLVLNDCFYILRTKENADHDKVMSVANSILEKHLELRKRVNHPDGKDNPKLVKQYYNAIAKELSNFIDEALENLNKAIAD